LAIFLCCSVFGGTAAVFAADQGAIAAWNPWEDIKESNAYFVDSHNQIMFATGAVAFLGARGMDSRAREYFANKQRIGKADQLGNYVLGTGVPGAILAGSFWIYGLAHQQVFEIRAGQSQLESILVTALFTDVLKATVHRERPDQSDHFSFPSGHTSTVFASATALYEYYGWKAGVPGFFLGVLTGASRLSTNRHWLSDTVGGAVAGLVVGHAFSQIHRKDLDLNLGPNLNPNTVSSKVKLSDITWLPIFEEDGARLVVNLTF
jgi:membrane-associated phospholipid phosphatase